MWYSGYRILYTIYTRSQVPSSFEEQEGKKARCGVGVPGLARHPHPTTRLLEGTGELEGYIAHRYNGTTQRKSISWC